MVASKIPLCVRRALRPPERLTPCGWAERYRVLSRRQSSRFGRWKHDSAPYLVIFDLPFKQRQVRKLHVKKMGQGGLSEGARNVVGYVASEEPDPVLLVLPDENSGKTIFGERILPMFDETPRLTELQTETSRDMKLSQVTLANGFTLRLAWSGSAASLASHPVRIVINDEVDKMQLFTGREADPISLAEVRTATYDNSLILNISTPTTRQGAIHNLEESAPIRLRYFCPCPHCGTPQRLVWDRVKWDKLEKAEKAARAAHVTAKQAAWYECATCGQRIHDLHKPKMVKQGFWSLLAPDDGVLAIKDAYRLYADGREEGTLPAGDEVGVQVSALYSLAAKHTFPAIAAEFIKCEGDIAKTMNFYNSTLGEVFEQQTSVKHASIFSRKCEGAPPPKVLPAWVSRVLMTVDTQKDHFWYVIRGWGHGRRSQRIMHGKVTSFTDLDQLRLHTFFPYEGDAYPAARVHMTGIDSGGGKSGVDGSRTDEVYRYCLKDPNWLKPLKGASEPQGLPVRVRKVTYTPPQGHRSPYEVWLHLLDVGHWNDVLDSAISAQCEVPDTDTGEVHEEDLWQLNAQDDDEYNRHLGNMEKVLIRDGKKRPVERWIPKTSGARVDLRDCEVYQFALAEIARVDLLPPAHVMAEERKRMQQAAPPKQLRTPDGRPFLVTQR